MKKQLYFIIIFVGVLFTSCSDPVSPIEEHLKKLWQIQLNEPIFTDIAVTNTHLIFRTQINTTGKLYKISKDGKNIQSSATGGSSIGAPIVQNSIIYSNNYQGTLFAVKESDLSTIWERSGFSWVPVPSIDETYLYVTEQNKISALDKTNGNSVWSTEIIGKNGATAIIEGNNIYFATGSVFFQDGYLYSINKYNGTVNYRVTLPYIPENSQIGGSAAGVEIWNERIFVSGDNKIFYCFEKKTGQLIWSFEADAPIQVTPRVSDAKIYFGTLNRTCYALDVNSGQMKWSYHGGGSILFKPSFYKNYVMFKSLGALVVLNKDNGNELFKMSSSTTEFGFDNAYWDSDGKIYTGGYTELDHNQWLITYQFK